MRTGEYVIDEAITRDFGVIWPRHVSSLTQFLIACRKSFDGDLDLFLVLCIIGDRTFSAQHAPSDLDFDAWSAANPVGVPSIEINAQSLSDYSGIPRETPQAEHFGGEGLGGARRTRLHHGDIQGKGGSSAPDDGESFLSIADEVGPDERVVKGVRHSVSKDSRSGFA